MLMGHPRSGSSLLMHMLCHHPKIIGFGEYLTRYDSLQKLNMAEFDIRRKAGGLYGKISYVANQVNHQRITPNIELLQRADTRFIFLIREPEAALSSMYLLSESRKKPMSYAAIGQVYTERLSSMQVMIKTLEPADWTATTYTQLTQQTEDTLEQLTAFLKLDTALKSTYSVQKFSQKWGDPSAHILEGKVVNTDSKQHPFPEEIVAACKEQHRKTLEFLGMGPTQ